MFVYPVAMPVPPVVRYRIAGGPAYLLGWEQRGAEWYGRIAWLDVRGDGQTSYHLQRIPAGDLQKIPGQDYRKVPLKREEAPPTSG